MKFIYTLVDEAAGRYSDQTAASVAFLRHLHPAATIDLWADPPTERALRDADHPLAAAVDALHAVDTGMASAPLRSRWLRTSLARLVDGPFLTLDGDTLCVQPLGEIFETAEPFAAASDCRAADPALAVNRKARAMSDAMGWPPAPRYFNGGVLYFDGSRRAAELGAAWHRHWLAFAVERGVAHLDQPALNHAIQETGVPVRVLPRPFNAMFHERPAHLRDARLWHLFTSVHPDAAEAETVFGEAARLARAGKLDAAAIQRVIDRRWPWTTDRSFRRRWAAGDRLAAFRTLLPVRGR
ncbi:glycosyltransferase family protein [Phycisphaera mikurensis]|uniref:Nucleotide-diphospho-sugar transferase domain-containing protein n=1 Tax=Phycisphaera mikurensis (strain NBRC 102666 / KCTC 22515 / FYK2301M01) TaxID=1142394 RepID=I0IC10_PHYMF|nr:hypothetical protein [Phycisphaera mikurensis]MBB6441978.1 hypothetical protein [Phycisphaera mikurensis]BAM02798.1 hypothetical protein PSMK_06390 [Phycisphaera mikurensis NBRC 102666]